MGAEAAGHAAVTLAKRPVPPRGTPGEARERRCAGVRAPKENQRDSVRNAMNRGVSAHGSTHGTGTDEPRCAMPAPDRALAEGIRRAPVPPRGTPTLQWKHKVAVATCITYIDPWILAPAAARRSWRPLRQPARRHERGGSKSGYSDYQIQYLFRADDDLLRTADWHAIRRPSSVVRLSARAADTCTPQQGAKEFGFRLTPCDVDNDQLVHRHDAYATSWSV
jgi:hypothetical protein